MLDTPWKINMNLQITNLERNMIFQTSRILSHVNLQGCSSHLSVLSCSQLVHPSLLVVQAAIHDHCDDICDQPRNLNLCF